MTRYWQELDFDIRTSVIWDRQTTIMAMEAECNDVTADLPDWLNTCRINDISTFPPYP